MSATSSAYSSRSATGSSGARPHCKAGRAPRAETRARRRHASRASERGPPRSGPRRASLGVRAQLAEPHVVGVRIEDDDLQVGLEQRLLEHDAERVGLAGARLAAEEGVPPEPARVEGERDAGREQQLPDLRAGLAAEPRSGRVARTSSGVAGRTVASWNGQPSPSRTTPSPSAPRITTWARLAAPPASATASSGPLGPGDLEGHDLAEPAVVALLEHDVRARLQLESVQRRLIARSGARRPTSRAEGSLPRAAGGRPGSDRGSPASRPAARSRTHPIHPCPLTHAA